MRGRAEMELHGIIARSSLSRGIDKHILHLAQRFVPSSVHNVQLLLVGEKVADLDDEDITFVEDLVPLYALHCIGLKQ